MESIKHRRAAHLRGVAALVSVLLLASASHALAQAPRAPAAAPPGAAPAVAPKAAAPLPEGWQEIDQRLVFLTVQLSTIESSIDATDKALKSNGYQKIAQEAAAEEARKRNVAMDRQGGGPVRWQEFYGRTAEKFFYHPTDGNTIHVNPDAVAQRPPQFDYIYRANELNRQKAEIDATNIGGKIDDLLAYRKQLEAEQSALWCKISFRGASSLALSERPLYRLELTGAAGDAAKQQLEAASAAVTFMKALDAELTAAQKGMDDQKSALDGLLSATSAARAEMQTKLLKLSTLAAAMSNPREPIAQFSLLSKRLQDSAQNLADAYRLAAECDAKEDLAAKSRYRSQIQEMAIDYAASVAAADKALTLVAANWKISPSAKDGGAVAAVTADANSITTKLENAKAAYATELTAARRALVSTIDNRLNASADAGDLASVQTFQSAKIKAATDGTLDDTMKDETVLAAKRSMDQSITASHQRLAIAYREAISNLTKARKITDAVAVQQEFKGTGLDTGVASTTGAAPAAMPAALDGDGAAEPVIAGEIVSVKLAGPAEDVVAGGGGRYLILHIKKLRQLAIFDVNAAKVVKYINAPSDDILYAAGRDKLIICVRETGSLQRWNLKTLTQEPSSQGIGPQIQAMAMGNDSAGPLVMSTPKATYLVNPDAAGRGIGMQWDGQWDSGCASLSVSGDGHTVVGYNFPGWAGTHTIILSGNHVVSRYSGGYIHYNDMLLPPDGGRIYDTMENGKIFSPDFKSESHGENLPGYGFPSYDPAYFVAWNEKGNDHSSTAKIKLAICNVSDRRPVTVLEDLPELDGSAPVKHFQRVHFIPKANVLVSIGPGGDEVVVRKLDIYKILEKQGVAYLVVTSVPPYTIIKGHPLIYQMAVKSLKGNVKYSLDSGPAGMTVSPQGVVRWTPAPHGIEETASVIVKVTDDSKQEVFHTFKLTLAGAPEAILPKPVKPAKPK